MTISHKITNVVKSAAGVSVTVEGIYDEDTELSSRSYLITRDTWITLDCSEGDSIDEEVVANLEAAAELCRAVARAVRILSYSDHSRSALIRKLDSFGFNGTVAEEAAVYAEKMGYLDEIRQAASISEYYIKHKYWGRKRIAAELLSKGYTRAAVMEAIASIDDGTYMSTLSKLMLRKYPEYPDDRHDREILVSQLSRMGYSMGEILTSLRNTYTEKA